MLTQRWYQIVGNRSLYGGNATARLCPTPLASFLPGYPLPSGAAFTRASTATYTANVPDSVLVLLAGDSTATATISRATTATYTTE